MAEELLPGTDAIPRATVEWTKRRGQHLVRMKNLDGRIAYHRTFDDETDACAYFWEQAYSIQEELHARKRSEAA